MYKKLLLLFMVLAVAPLCAAQSKNTMKMVTYFPIPYVAYDTVEATEVIEVGGLDQCVISASKGTSNLAGTDSALYLYGDANGDDLTRGLLNVTAGKLDLNSSVPDARIVSKKVLVGADMDTQGGWLDIGVPAGKDSTFNALYIDSLASAANSFRVTSLENAATVDSFHMFDEIENDFPGCAGTVTWKELELGADPDTNQTFTDVYLVCEE